MRNGQAVRLARLGRALARRRRQRARQLQPESDRKLPGRVSHPAGQARARGRSCSRTSSISSRPIRACRSRTGAISTASSTRSISASGGSMRCSTNTATTPSRRRSRRSSARAEALMRANIAALPDGTYSYDDFLDNDGITDAPLRIALDLTIAGDRMTLDFSRSAPPCDGPLNIARSTDGRLLLRRAQASLHRRARQCRLPGADRIRHPRHDAARRLGAAAGRRLHRDDPARHRRHLRRLRQGRAGARQRQSVRHHQCAVARRLARGRPALGDVLLLRRRARRQSGERRPQSRQQSDLDGDHSAGGDPASRSIR